MPWGLSGEGRRELTPRTLLELPEKQEQLAAIYAVLEHLPEANHNSLERLIFHLVKQVPAVLLPRSLGGGVPARATPRRSPGWRSLVAPHQDVSPYWGVQKGAPGFFVAPLHPAGASVSHLPAAAALSRDLDSGLGAPCGHPLTAARSTGWPCLRT